MPTDSVRYIFCDMMDIGGKMAFEFILSNDEIREKMFDFIKPIYKNTWDFDVCYINWIYGVYDSESGFFITYVNQKSDNTKYILITGNGENFYIIANRYRHTFSEIPDELKQYGDIIQTGIKLYNNEKIKKRFMSSFSGEAEKCLNEITENMRDKCRPAIVINSYEDAEKLFKQDNFNYYHISHMYTKNTVANFDKYMSNEKMCTIRGEKYRNIISKISAYGNNLSEEDYKQISKDFHEASGLNTQGIDDICVEMTFEVIKKAYLCGVISVGYIDFINNYINNCIKLYPDKIQSLRPILDFINEYMRGENFKSLEFYRKELEKLIYKKVEGFQFVLTTNELREKMFDSLKPEYKSKYDLNVTNINWTTGVYDKESGIFLTKIYYVSDGIARCGVHYHSYIVITDNGNVFKVDNNDEFEKGTYDFRIPKQYEILTEKIKEGIDFYGYNYKYRETLGEDIKKELKVINDIMDDRCHRNFSINCEEDARKFFVHVNFNIHTILDTYNKKTVDDFNKFATDNKLVLWRGDKYLQLLNEVTSVFVKNQERCQSFNKACKFFRDGVNDTYDKQFLKAVKYMYNARIMGVGDENALKSYINAYTEEYPDKLKNIVPLIEFVKTRTENKYLKETIENVNKCRWRI